MRLLTIISVLCWASAAYALSLLGPLSTNLSAISDAYEYRDLATSESPVHGSVAGTFVDTHAADLTAETITEAVYHSNGRVRLEHVWTFNVTGSDLGVRFHLAGQTDGETFQFEYDAQDGAGWHPLAVLTSASITCADLPASLSGEVLVRVRDAVSKDRVADALTIDEMCFVSERTSTLPPRVSISADGPRAGENRRAGQFHFKLADYIAHPTDLTVSFTIGGTAAQSDYYETLSGSVVIPAGQLDVYVSVTPVDDDEEEGTETLVLALVDHEDYVVGIPAEAVLEIADNDLTQFFAQSEESIYGTATGDYTATHAPDGVSQILAEERYTKGNQKSRLEHRWSFDLGCPVTVQLVLSARHLTPDDPDSFRFQFSPDNGFIWLTLATGSPSSLPDQTSGITSSSGHVTLRVIDTDSSKDRSPAQIAVDHMFFRVVP